MLACPSCAPGIEARSLVLSQDFSFHLSAVLLPIVLSGVLALVLVRWMRGDR